MRAGPGRVLLAVYAVFALAATARSAVQIATRFTHAPVAYVLSAVAAVVYLAATVLVRSALAGRRVRTALVMVSMVELTGVLTVGAASLLAPRAFPDATVWSHFGSGYGFVPVLLPPAALAWCGRPVRRSGRGVRSSR